MLRKTIEKKLNDLSRCPGCGHSSAANNCTCKRADCACGKD